MIADRQDHQHSVTSHLIEETELSGKKIFWVVILNAAITIVEFIGGILSGSLALLSDAVHNLSDTVALIMTYYANRIAQKPRDVKKTFGYKRAEILAAFINASILLAICGMLIIEALKRFRSPETIDGSLMVTVAVIGLIANFVSVLLLKKDAHHNLNINSSYLHLLGDTVSSVGVILGGLVIIIWGIIWVDPLVTLLISLYIISKAWNVVRKAVDILMQSSAELDYEKLKEGIETLSGVKNIHHVHTWLSNEKTIYFEAHLEIDDMLLSEAEKVITQVEDFLKINYGISHVTLQAEVDRCCDKAMFNSH